MTNEESPADDAGLDDSRFGAFVVSCDTVVDGEVKRLIRTGLRADADDVRQEAFRILLEEKEKIAERPSFSLVRIILRRRLLSEFVVRNRQKKRDGVEVSADDIAHALEDAAAHVDAGNGAWAPGSVDQGTIEKLSVPSHEDDVIERVSFDEMVPIIDVLTMDVSRQELHRRRRDLLPWVQRFAKARSAA